MKTLKDIWTEHSRMLQHEAPVLIRPRLVPQAHLFGDKIVVGETSKVIFFPIEKAGEITILGSVVHTTILTGNSLWKSGKALVVFESQLDSPSIKLAWRICSLLEHQFNGMDLDEDHVDELRSLLFSA